VSDPTRIPFFLGNRNYLSHGYFNESYTSVWNTVQLHLPALRAAVAALLP
jgi:uncharacterized protein with HEPN domain